MAKWVCNVCGYVYEGETAPEKCPVCGAPASKFRKQEEEMTWAAEHVVGVASDVPDDIKEDLRANFNGECSEVGMYLAMSRVAMREGYPEIAEVKDRLLSLGATTASMSGSGSSVFGLFQDSAGAERACEALSAVWPVRRMRICTGM